MLSLGKKLTRQEDQKHFLLKFARQLAKYVPKKMGGYFDRSQHKINVACPPISIRSILTSFVLLGIIASFTVYKGFVHMLRRKNKVKT